MTHTIVRIFFRNAFIETLITIYIFKKKENNITTTKKFEKGLIRKHFNLFWSKIYFKQKQFWFDFMELLLLLIIWRGKEKHGKITGNTRRLLQQSSMGHYLKLKISLRKFYCKSLINWTHLRLKKLGSSFRLPICWKISNRTLQNIIWLDSKHWF